MNNPGLTKNLVAETALSAFRIVKFGTAGTVVHATSASDNSIGVNDMFDPGANQRTDIVMTGITRVEYGSAVTEGDRLTAAADGKAVPVSAATDVVIGIAMVSGVANDIGSVLLK